MKYEYHDHNLGALLGLANDIAYYSNASNIITF